MDGYIAAKALILRPTRPRQHRRSLASMTNLAATCSPKLQGAGRKLIPISVERAVAGGVYALDGMLMRPHRRRSRARSLDLRPIADPARQPQLAERRRRLRRRRAPGPRPRRDRRRRSRPIPACRTARSWSRPSTACASSTTARRPTPTPPPRRSPATTPIYWIVGGRAKEGGIAGLEPFYPRVAPRLPDRRGAPNDFAAAARRPASPSRSAARWTSAVAAAHARARRRRASRARSCCCRRPAPRSTSSPISRRAATSSASWCWRLRRPQATAAEGGAHDRPSRAPNQLRRRPLVVDRRPLDAGGARRADRSAASILVLAASPAVAERIGLDSFHFVRQHYVMLPAALGAGDRRLAAVAAAGAAPRRARCSCCSLGLTALTLVYRRRDQGRARAGSRSAGFSLQPSEFVKPTFADRRRLAVRAQA